MYKETNTIRKPKHIRLFASIINCTKILKTKSEFSRNVYAISDRIWCNKQLRHTTTEIWWACFTVHAFFISIFRTVILTTLHSLRDITRRYWHKPRENTSAETQHAQDSAGKNILLQMWYGYYAMHNAGQICCTIGNTNSVMPLIKSRRQSNVTQCKKFRFLCHIIVGSRCDAVQYRKNRVFIKNNNNE